MKRVAIPVTNNLLSEYFGECSNYEIFEIHGNAVNKTEMDIPENAQIKDLPEWLENQGITDVITYKVNPGIISLFASRKVNLFVGIPINHPNVLIEDYLLGRLESNQKIIEEITLKEYKIKSS